MWEKRRYHYFDKNIGVFEKESREEVIQKFKHYYNMYLTLSESKNRRDYLEYGKCLAELGKHSEAKDIYQKALGLTSNNDNTIHAEIYCQLAILEIENKKC